MYLWVRAKPSCMTCRLPGLRTFSKFQQVIHKSVNLSPLKLGKLLVVEGNIAAGKSTLSKRLGECFDYKIYDEPAPKNPYLAKYYENPLKYSLKLQLWLFQQRFSMYLDAMQHIKETGQGVIMDRSVISDLIFTNVVFQEGKMSNDGYQYYLKARKKAMEGVRPPFAIIYLDVPTNVCHQRITRRGRGFEQGIPLEYLDHLSEEHEKVLQDFSIKESCPLLKYDWSEFGFGSGETRDSDSGERLELYVTGLNKIVKDIENIDSSSWSPSIPERFKEFSKDPSVVDEVMKVDGYDKILRELPDH